MNHETVLKQLNNLEEEAEINFNDTANMSSDYWDEIYQMAQALSMDDMGYAHV